MNLPSFPAQHLSDEAVAAFADGALGNGARGRAARHIAQCAECAHAVAVQREAVWALRAAPAPTLPGGLLDRLRAVPSTTPLSGPPIAVDTDGSTVFPAYGSAALVAPEPPEPEQRAHATGRRVRPYGLLTAAAAVVALGAVGGTVAGTSDAGPSVPAPNAPVRVQPVGSTTTDLFVQPALGPALRAQQER
jgi:anti-sigma factor RsiW